MVIPSFASRGVIVWHGRLLVALCCRLGARIWVEAGSGRQDAANNGISAPAHCQPCGISEVGSWFPDSSMPLICPTGFSAWQTIMISLRRQAGLRRDSLRPFRDESIGLAPFLWRGARNAAPPSDMPGEFFLGIRIPGACGVG
jgi:hypothetical protein